MTTNLTDNTITITVFIGLNGALDQTPKMEANLVEDNKKNFSTTW